MPKASDANRPNITIHRTSVLRAFAWRPVIFNIRSLMQPTASNYFRWIYPAALLIAAIAIAVAVPLAYCSEGSRFAFCVDSEHSGATLRSVSMEKEARKVREARREALNRASFVLIRQANAIHQMT